MSKFYESSKSTRSKKVLLRKGEQKNDQYWKSSEGVAVCPICKNVLFKKEWHHSDSKVLGKDFFSKKEFEKKEHHFKQCPACKMIKEGLYEGEISIKDVPVNHKDEVLKTIKAFAERGKKRDPQSRIIRIRKDRNSFNITTTENQMAVRIAKYLHKTFKKSQLSISHSKEPYEVSRVELVFMK
ncbi:MAG: NMD3-related protein [Candidatus Pacebacteria bacterium]|nr:NMD3-related protein [Candidatus Paceibacterota bacterium]